MGSTDPILLPDCLMEVKDDLPIIRLPHPRTGLPSLFIIRDSLDFWEIQSVVSPTNSSRSWFFQPSGEDEPDQVLSQQAGRLLFVTPFDPFFLLLGLFFGNNKTTEGIYNPFDQNSKSNNKKDYPNSRYEEIDSLVEKVQDDWKFINNGDRPTMSDVELFMKVAFNHQHLSRIFTPLEQDSEITLWRVDPERIINELKRKINQLATSGLEAGRKSNTIWARLATEEVISLDINENSNASFLLNEIYKKISLNMIQSYLPKCLSDNLSNQNDLKFDELEEEKKKKINLSTRNPLEIGRKDNKRNEKSLKVPIINKKIKKNQTLIPSKSNTRQIDSFFIKSNVPSSSKK